MSSYRDDTQEIAIASDSVWGQLTTLAEEAVKITSTLIVGLLLTVAESAVASDQVIDNTRYLVVEQAVISDTVIDGKRSTFLMIESAKASDKIVGVLKVVHIDQVAATDIVIDRTRATVSESAHIADTVIAQRRTQSLVEESVKIRDVTMQVASFVVSESASAADWTGGIKRGKQLITESVSAVDSVVDTHETTSRIIDSAQIQSSVLDHVTARNIVEEIAVIEDDVLGSNAGQAWTANTDTWAMSRYSPYTFNSLSVINGVLYGIADDGIYAINGGDSLINGMLMTGKVDLSVKGALVHPLAAYLEYELSGANKTAQMDVTTTQSGTAQTYTYILPLEKADELTSSRFIFGRGLRGRHFTFSLRMNGVRGYINALGVELSPTNRRV